MTSQPAVPHTQSTHDVSCGQLVRGRYTARQQHSSGATSTSSMLCECEAISDHVQHTS